MPRVRGHLSYANVVATIALFVALGGSSYALSLPRNSVGPKELQPDSVGRSELKRNAVRSSSVKNRSLRLRDLGTGTRAALQGPAGPVGPQGPPGPTYFAAVNSAGRVVRGNARQADLAGSNTYLVVFPRDVGQCVATASIAAVPGGVAATPNGHATIEPAAGAVLVRTWSANGTPTELPFHIIVAC